MDGDPSGSLLKDGGLLTLDAWSQLIMGYTLMAARAGQLPIRVFTLTLTLRRGSPTLDAPNHPILRYTLMAA